MNKHISLDKLAKGQCATVISVGGETAMRQRLRDIGVTEGTNIFCVMKSPLGDPVAYLIRGAVIALRQEDSRNVGVILTTAEVQYGTNT